MCLFCRKLHVLYLLSLNLCYKWKIDYVTIHILPQKIRVGCIYFDADQFENCPRMRDRSN